MAASIGDSLQGACDALWAARFSSEQEAVHSVTFAALVREALNVYASIRPDEATEASLSRSLHKGIRNLFRSTGAPWFATQISSPSHLAARELYRALTATKARSVFLCPLDRSPSLPNIDFGPCKVRCLSETELQAIIQSSRIINNHPSAPFDARRFARFTWLVIDEARPVSKLAVRVLQPSFRWFEETPAVELTSVRPHRSRYSPVVEQAIFAMLLVPWEQFIESSYAPWKPFHVPWVYTVPHDPFAEMDRPPSPDSLSWRPVIYADDSEDEEPDTNDQFAFDPSELCKSVGYNWDLAQVTCPTHVESGAYAFNQLVRHFIIRALEEDGIDEVIFHSIAIEAALAIQKEFGSTDKIARRIKNLLQSTHAESEFKRLYELRSNFVHGRRLEDLMPAEDLNKLRSIARTTAMTLMEKVWEEDWVERDLLLGVLTE